MSHLNGKKAMHWPKTSCRPEDLAVTIVLFLAAIAGGLYILLAPKQTFSENENRVLQGAPEITLEALLKGSFADETESFVNDQFPLRTEFLCLNTLSQKAVGRRDLGGNYAVTPAEGGVYFGAKGHIYEVLLENESGIFQKNAQALLNFSENAGIPLWIMPVPSGSQEQKENLPLLAENHDQREELEYFQENAAGETYIVDTFDVLGSWNGDFYYKTDHHWNSFGAYEGYKQLVSEMGLQPLPKDAFTFRLASTNFLGTLYSKAVDFTQQPDEIYLPQLKTPQNIVQSVGGEEREGLYWEEYLQKKDQYSTFLGGNHSVKKKKNLDQTNGKKILLLKDSYANSLVPFLCTHFSEIHIIDLRYYSQNVYEYIQENDITSAAAVYSIKQLSDVDISNKLLS